MKTCATEESRVNNYCKTRYDINMFKPKEKEEKPEARKVKRTFA